MRWPGRRVNHAKVAIWATTLGVTDRAFAKGRSESNPFDCIGYFTGTSVIAGCEAAAYNREQAMAVPPVSNFLGRTLAPWQIRGDLVEDERILATAQVVLAISSLVVLYFDPAEPSRYANLV